MKLTIIQAGDVPEQLHPRFGVYPPMFGALFDAAGASFSYETVAVFQGAELPDPAGLQAIIVTGSAFGVYDPEPWMEPLRNFIRAAYVARTPMLGVCFGHQIIADAMGGDVRKSEKGWAIGHHHYRLTRTPDFMQGAPQSISLLAMHQDQVVAPPAEAKIFLASDFTPSAGLVYANGAAFSVQPHPEFETAYVSALLDLLPGKFPAPQGNAARARFGEPLDSVAMGGYLASKFNLVHARATAIG